MIDTIPKCTAKPSFKRALCAIEYGKLCKKYQEIVKAIYLYKIILQKYTGNLREGIVKMHKTN